ncbi:ABC transporter substrate-binding protein [Gordonia sp. TBRC 11910]|uniref:ABC transporter substrate-binding protein n=1 Tax=Gordonia asplenii TaxID=2725283 RepID=A0A848KPM9_9ACTN|nr:ABC transporter substrate-binding protein [Gordonia asplenii]NMO00984.1 ABC transporter substrate-binding protein [Gordonia asplenii]
MTFTVRIAALVGVLAVVGALAACGGSSDSTATADTRSYVDASGRAVQVPKNPQRVVTLAEGALDGALALDVTPVGTTSGRGQTGIPAYLGAHPDIPIVASTRAPNLGQILKLRPDLIIVDDTTGARNSIDELTKIAPTVFVAKYADGWEKYFAAMGDVLGRADKHQAVVAEIDSTITKVSARVAAAPGAKPLTASVVRWAADGPTIVGGNSLSSWVLKRVGMSRPPAQQKVDSANRSGQKVSLENLDLIDADYLFFGVLGSVEQARKDLAAAQTRPGFAELTAQKSGHVVAVDGTPWTSGSGPLGVEAVLADIDGAVK